MISKFLERLMASRNQLVFMLVPACLLTSGDAYACDSGESNNTISGFLKGAASWYGNKFHGRRTASGQIFNQNDFTCAHRTLPFGTHLVVKNPATGMQCEVVVNDRGPYRNHRVLDLSRAAARKLGITGVAKVAYKTGKFVANTIDFEDEPNKKLAATRIVNKIASAKPVVQAVSEKRVADYIDTTSVNLLTDSEKSIFFTEDTQIQVASADSTSLLQ